MKYALLMITLILFSSIVYLQLKKELPKNSIATKMSNKNHKESIQVNTKRVTSEHSKIVNTTEVKKFSTENNKIEEIPYHDELSLDSNYNPDYERVEQKQLTEEELENLEKNSEIINTIILFDN